MKDVGTYFLVSRNIFDSDIWRERPILTKIFIWLIGQARYKEEPEMLLDVEIKRGEVVTSLNIIAEANQYLENKQIIKLSRTTIIRILKELSDKGYIEELRNTYGTHIKICNYDTYQSQENYQRNNIVTTELQHSYNIVTTPYITKQVKQVNHLKQENIRTVPLTSPSLKKEKSGNREQSGTEKQKNPDIKTIIDYFYDHFKMKTGVSYHVQGAKDGNLIKKLLGTYKLEEMKALIVKYFQSEDEFILKAGYSIGVFYSQIPKLVMPQKHSLSGIGGMDELKKWAVRRNVEFGGKNE